MVEVPTRSLNIDLAVALFPRLFLRLALSRRVSTHFPQGLGWKVSVASRANSPNAILGALACPSISHHKLSDE